MQRMRGYILQETTGGDIMLLDVCNHLQLRLKTPSTNQLQLMLCADQLNQPEHTRSSTISTTGNAALYKEYQAPEQHATIH